MIATKLVIFMINLASETPKPRFIHECKTIWYGIRRVNKLYFSIGSSTSVQQTIQMDEDIIAA